MLFKSTKKNLEVERGGREGKDGGSGRAVEKEEDYKEVIDP